MWQLYSDRELIDIVIKLNQKLGRPPRKKDMGSVNNAPSVTTYYKRFDTKKWSDILEVCGLKQIWDKGYDESFGLDKLKEYYKEINKVPTYNDFKKYGWIPEFNWYARNFGSYKYACYLAGISQRPLTKEERMIATIDEINDLYIELDKIPTKKEYDKYRIEGYSSNRIQDIFGTPYTTFCSTYIENYYNKYDITIDKYKSLISDYMSKVKRVPLCEELGYTYKFLITNFNKNYTEILNEMGLEPFQYNQISDEKLLEDFYLLYKKLRHVPSYDELDNSEITCNGVTYNRRFGGIENVCNILNIEYDRHYSFGTICHDNNGVLCNSTKERDISNFFIENNIEYEKEVSYSELIDSDNRKFDWKIRCNNKIYYVEYFGLYFMDKKESRVIKSYINKARKKIKDLYKNNVIENCIFIFPDNIHHLDELFKIKK